MDATGNTGNFPEIMIQPNGQPAIAYLEYASMGVPDRIRYARRVGPGSWVIETVEDNVSSGQAYLGATLDPQGFPVVTYQGLTPGGFNLELHYAEKINGSWRIKVPPVPAPGPALAEEVKPAPASWALAITARQGDRAAEPMYVGAAANTEDAAALRSWQAPAAPDGGSLSLNVERGSEAMVRDFQLPASTMSWQIRTDGGVAPGEQSLSFQGFDVPVGMKFFLADRGRLDAW